MAFSNILFGAGTRPAQPVVRKIDLADLRDALAKGADDFYAMPTHAIFLCIIYPIVGFALARLAFGYSILPLLYPLASGFALVGPIAALGLYAAAGKPGLTHRPRVLSTYLNRLRSAPLRRWEFCS